jgi:hypothetical protein
VGDKTEVCEKVMAFLRQYDLPTYQFVMKWVVQDLIIYDNCFGLGDTNIVYTFNAIIHDIDSQAVAIKTFVTPEIRDGIQQKEKLAIVALNLHNECRGIKSGLDIGKDGNLIAELTEMQRKFIRLIAEYCGVPKCVSIIGLNGPMIYTDQSTSEYSDLLWDNSDRKGFVPKIVKNESLSGFSNTGIQNSGMTCYANSTFQMLYMLPEFRWLVMNYGGRDELILTVKGLFEEIQKGKQPNTEKLWKAIGSIPGSNEFKSGNQDTALAFFLFIVGRIEEEQRNLFSSSFNTIVKDTARVVKEGTEFYRFNSVGIVRLNDTSSIQEGISLFFKEYESVWHHAGQIKNVDRRNTFEYVPPLVLFYISHEREHEVNNEIKINDKDYTLQMVVLRTPLGGEVHHFRYYVRHPSEWLEFNDSSRSLINEANFRRNLSKQEHGTILVYKEVPRETS